MKLWNNTKEPMAECFPTCSEILEVIRSLGYVRTSTTSQIESTAEELERQLDSLVDGKTESAKS